MFNKIPDELKQLNQWVCVWDNSKIPMQALIKKGASSTNPDTWSSFQNAENAVLSGIYDGLGFVFNDNSIVGIDIDCGYDEDGFLSPTSVDIMNKCRSYTERSRSGRGMHILVKGTLPFKGKNNQKGVEIYQASRYFITTGNVLVYPDLIENQSAIDYVVNRYFADELPRCNNTKSNSLVYRPIFKKPQGNRIYLRPEYPKIKQGLRNLSLTSLAGQLYQCGWSTKEIYRELLFCNQKACKPPLPVNEVESIVKSIARYSR